MVKRGEVWLAALDPTVGSEIRKTRPCLIVSPDELNAHLRTVLSVPLTTGGRPAPFRVPVTFQRKQGLILPLLTAALAVIWGVGVMGASGMTMDVFNSTTPILILAVATGHAVQLLKRYYEEYYRLREQGKVPAREM